MKYAGGFRGKGGITPAIHSRWLRFRAHTHERALRVRVSERQAVSECPEKVAPGALGGGKGAWEFFVLFQQLFCEFQIINVKCHF